MTKIQDIINEYRNKVDYLDLEIIIANSLNKTREFILTYPEYELTKFQISNFKFQIKQRLRGEPVAYILGHKEFYGLNFVVNKHTLVPRPETEQIIDLVINESVISHQSSKKITIVDVGTGSGNITISIAKAIENLKFQISNFKFIGIDISPEALRIAKKNAKIHNVDKKIKFLHGNLLEPFLKAKKLMPDKLVITANLPYLSKEIYNSAPIDVKKFEPKSALYSPEQGLQHYRKLLKQIQKLLVTSYELRVTIFLEISPEQKVPLTKIIESILPTAKIEFKKDLANKWRICKISI